MPFVLLHVDNPAEMVPLVQKLGSENVKFTAAMKYNEMSNWAAETEVQMIQDPEGTLADPVVEPNGPVVDLTETVTDTKENLVDLTVDNDVIDLDGNDVVDLDDDVVDLDDDVVDLTVEGDDNMDDEDINGILLNTLKNGFEAIYKINPGLKYQNSSQWGGNIAQDAYKAKLKKVVRKEEDNGKNYTCTFCSKEFPIEAALVWHTVQNHKEEAKKKKKAASRGKKKNPPSKSAHKCGKCDKMFCSKSNALRHQRTGACESC